MTSFQSPKYTQTPNDLFDHLMKDMNKSELKVVLAVIRRTLGFHRKAARIDIREMQEMTGLSTDAIYAGASAAAARGLLIKINKHGTTEWRINWSDVPFDRVEMGILETPEIPPEWNAEAAKSDSDFGLTGTPSIKESSKETPKETNMRQAQHPTSEENQKARIRAILETQGIDTTDLLSHVGTSRINQDRVDVSNFPEPYQITIERFCRLWRVPVPEKVAGKSGAFGDWINGARDLMTAYAEYGPELLDLVYWGGDWLKTDGDPFTVARPAAVLKWTQARCGNLRQRGINPQQLNTQIEFAMESFGKKASRDVFYASQEIYVERAANRKQIELDARVKATT